MKKPRLTREQKKSYLAYVFAEKQEDRYNGSVFVTTFGQRQYEAKTKDAYELCKRLNVPSEYL